MIIMVVMVTIIAMLLKAKESRETREKTSQTSPKKPVRSLGKKQTGQQAGSDQVQNEISDSGEDDVGDVKGLGCCQ